MRGRGASREGGRALCAVVCRICFPLAPHGGVYRGGGAVGASGIIAPSFPSAVAGAEGSNSFAWARTWGCAAFSVESGRHIRRPFTLK